MKTQRCAGVLGSCRISSMSLPLSCRDNIQNWSPLFLRLPYLVQMEDNSICQEDILLSVGDIAVTEGR